VQSLSPKEKHHKIMSFSVCGDILISKNSSVVCTFVSTIGSSHPNANAMYHECTAHAAMSVGKKRINNKDNSPFRSRDDDVVEGKIDPKAATRPQDAISRNQKHSKTSSIKIKA
jgi:hypothetical protein